MRCSRRINGLPLAAIYALLAAAYSLVYGLVGRINLAFGEFAAAGGYAAALGALLAAALTPRDDPRCWRWRSAARPPAFWGLAITAVVVPAAAPAPAASRRWSRSSAWRCCRNFFA